MIIIFTLLNEVKGLTHFNNKNSVYKQIFLLLFDVLVATAVAVAVVVAKEKKRLGIPIHFKYKHANLKTLNVINPETFIHPEKSPLV